jgi:hypothetical protein
MAGQALAQSRLEADIRNNTGRDIRDLIPDWMERGFDGCQSSGPSMPIPGAESGNGERPKVKKSTR